MAHTLQDRYSPLVDAKLRASIVKADGVIFNTRYEGDPKAGAVKVPVRDAEVAVGAYNKASGLAIQTGATSYATITINKDYGVNELIDGYDAAAVPDNLVADRLDSAGYALALQMDKDATAALESGGTPFTGITSATAPKVNGAVTAGATQLAIDGTALVGKLYAGEQITIGGVTFTVKETTAAASSNAIAVVKTVEELPGISDNADVTINGYGDVTSATVYAKIVDARTRLSKMFVPETKRFLLVSPDVYAMVLKDNTYFVHATLQGDNVIASASVGQIAGFNVYVDATLSPKTEFIAGHPDWCCRVAEWAVPVHLQDLGGSGLYIGASAVQGRRVYAHAVTKPQTVLVKSRL